MQKDISVLKRLLFPWPFSASYPAVASYLLPHCAASQPSPLMSTRATIGVYTDRQYCEISIVLQFNGGGAAVYWRRDEDVTAYFLYGGQILSVVLLRGIRGGWHVYPLSLGSFSRWWKKEIAHEGLKIAVVVLPPVFFNKLLNLKGVAGNCLEVVGLIDLLRSDLE